MQQDILATIEKAEEVSDIKTHSATDVILSMFPLAEITGDETNIFVYNNNKLIFHIVKEGDKLSRGYHYEYAKMTDGGNEFSYNKETIFEFKQ